MKKEKIQNDAKRLLLSLMALAGAVSLNSCQTTKGWGDAVWGGTKVTAATVLGATPFIKDAAKAFDKSMDDWGDEALKSAEKNFEQEKFDEVKNNREKYASVAQALAKYCLKKSYKDKPLAEGDLAPDPETVPHISEILNNKAAISRALTGSFLEDKKNALELFRVNFFELSKIVSNDDMIQMMQALYLSAKRCQVYPLFSLASENAGRRVVARQIAQSYGYSQWENEKIQSAEDRLNAVKHRRNQVEEIKKTLVKQ